METTVDDLRLCATSWGGLKNVDVTGLYNAICELRGKVSPAELEAFEMAGCKLIGLGIPFTPLSLFGKIVTLEKRLPLILTRDPDAHVSFAEIWRLLDHEGPMDADFFTIAVTCIFGFMQGPKHQTHGDWVPSERPEGTCFEGLAPKK